TAREAFRDLGIPDFPNHVLVSVSPGFGRLETATILIKKSPFTAADVKTFLDAARVVEGTRVIYTGPDSPQEHAVAKAILLAGAERDAWYAGLPYKVGPITDDSPFFWHFVGFDSVLFG